MAKIRTHIANTPQLVKYTDDREYWTLLVAQNRILNPANRLDQMFSTGGDGSGTVDMATTAAKYSVAAPAGKRIFIERVCFHMMDTGIRLNRYLGISELTNGVKVYARDDDDSLLHDFTPHPITIAGHYALLAGVDTPVTTDVGDDTLSVRWTIAKAGYPLMLTAGQYLEIDVRDDLSNITEQHAQAQGWIEDL